MQQAALLSELPLELQLYFFKNRALQREWMFYVSGHVRASGVVELHASAWSIWTEPGCWAEVETCFAMTEARTILVLNCTDASGFHVMDSKYVEWCTELVPYQNLVLQYDNTAFSMLAHCRFYSSKRRQTWDTALC